MSAKQGNSPWRWRQHISPKYNVKMQTTFIWWLTSSGLSNCRPRNHTWPTYWYLWLANDKSKCQFYNRVLQEGCDIHGTLWNSTVMCENLTAWTLHYPLLFGVKDSQFPSTMRYVNIFTTDSKMLSSVTHHFGKTKLHAVTSTTTNPVSTYPIM